MSKNIEIYNNVKGRIRTSLVYEIKQVKNGLIDFVLYRVVTNVNNNVSRKIYLNQISLFNGERLANNLIIFARKFI